MVHHGRTWTGTEWANMLAHLRATIDTLIQFAEARGHTILELAVSWLLARPVVASVIAGATKPEQVHANAGAAAWRLTEADLGEIDRIVGQPA